MTKISQQITIGDINDEYKAFVDKFKPKKTTDDCYTPDNVYQAVLDWVVETYSIDSDNVKRPFWPGGDYEAEEYPDGCVVVDNPPFSIISRICATYQAHGIRFFLFAPFLTNFSSQANGICHIITDCSIMYENGAEVNTAFLTNLEPEYEIMTAPDLRKRIVEADKVNRQKKTKTLPKYSYPPEVVTATMIGYISKYGIDFRIRRGECFFIRNLDSQKAAGKSLFGSGYLLSEHAAAEKAAAEKAAAEKAAAEKWRLSDREREIVKKPRKGETMTTEECKRPFAMLHANWPFLDFTDETTALIWFEAFRPYMEPEVRQGISDAIANITARSAPTVGEIMEYIRNVHDGFRRLEKEEEAKGSGSDSVSCQLCNDYGWQTIIYPSGYEAVRACSCSAAMKAFGEKALKRQTEDKPRWWDRQMFGENEIPGQYELVRVSRTPVPTGEKYKDAQGNLQERMTWGWTPYFPRQGREEVFLQYQKRRRKA